ncbi:breast carcinoma-amplified sequence 4 [Amblyraja radiata]|uniref:breast carcinoma-amplified sequence 4 n=1 Tax=Amblyraja radiata TaxID=386614 RepID=UPI001403A771|nr:breast carcinoma-amplified sequence 4 [Amblyraja radiata]
MEASAAAAAAAGDEGSPELDSPAVRSRAPVSEADMECVSPAGEQGSPVSEPECVSPARWSGSPESVSPAGRSPESVSPDARRGAPHSVSSAAEMQSWVVRQDAQELAASLRADPCSEAKELEGSIEEMLIRLDEFCGMLDMIRNDSSQILDENIPKIKDKALEMKEVYAKIDKMEIFVKMVEQSAATLEEQVVQAEKDCSNLSRGVCKFLHSINAPFVNKNQNLLNEQNLTYELPNLYRTEAYFPANPNRTFFKPNNS